MSPSSCCGICDAMSITDDFDDFDPVRLSMISPRTEKNAKCAKISEFNASVIENETMHFKKQRAPNRRANVDAKTEKSSMNGRRFNRRAMFCRASGVKKKKGGRAAVFSRFFGYAGSRASPAREKSGRFGRVAEVAE